MFQLLFFIFLLRKFHPFKRYSLNENEVNLDTIESCLKDYSEAFAEILKIISLIKTLTISIISNEKLFPLLERIKSYLRTTMENERLNDLMAA